MNLSSLKRSAHLASDAVNNWWFQGHRPNTWLKVLFDSLLLQYPPAPALQIPSKTLVRRPINPFFFCSETLPLNFSLEYKRKCIGLQNHVLQVLSDLCSCKNSIAIFLPSSNWTKMLRGNIKINSNHKSSPEASRFTPYVFYEKIQKLLANICHNFTFRKYESISTDVTKGH